MGSEVNHNTKWPNVANTKPCSVINAAPLQPQGSKSSLRPSTFWGPASIWTGFTYLLWLCLQKLKPSGKQNQQKLLAPQFDLSSNGLSWGRKETCCWTPFTPSQKDYRRRKEVMAQFHYSQQANVLHTVNPALNIYISTSQQTVFFHKLPAKVISHSQAAAILLRPFQGLNFTVTR